MTSSIVRCALFLIFAVAACSVTPTEQGGASNPSPTPTTRPTPETPVDREGPREIPQPTFTGASTGCNNVTAYRASDDGTQWLGIEVESTKQGLAVGSVKTIDLGNTPEGTLVFVDVYAAPPVDAQYCASAKARATSKTQWTAEAGALTIELLAKESDGSFRANIHLEHAHFTGPERGIAIVVPNVTIDNVRVGWSP